MTTTTPNLSLTLYDSSADQAVNFATYRAVWGGPATTSNFYKIDTAYGVQAAQIAALQNTKGAISVPAAFISANFYQVTGITTIASYIPGMTIILSVDTTSNGTVTLDINNLGTKSVMKVDSTGTAINLTGSDLVKGRYYLFAYDGTRWLWVSPSNADQTAEIIHGMSAKNPPADADEIPLIDSAASYALKKITVAVLKLAIYLGIKPPEGIMWNGRILPSVTSNNLTCALKTFAGTDPSATDPVYITLNGAVRTITAALSVTVNAGAVSGTGTFNAGALELANQEIDYATYLGWNTTDGVVMTISRLFHGKQYSDFSTTPSSERYAAISTITHAASTDYYSPIGRFAAINSGTPSYNWSVPTFTAINLIQRPIDETRPLTYTIIAGATAPMTFTLTSTTQAVYQIKNRRLFEDSVFAGTTGTSGTSAINHQAPMTPTYYGYGLAVVFDGGSGLNGQTQVNLTQPALYTQRYDNAAWGIGTGRQIRESISYLIG